MTAPAKVLLLLALSACAAGPASAPSSEDVTFIDDDGTVKPPSPGGTPLADIGLSDNLVRLRCSVSTEGRVFGCTRLSGPPVMEDRLVEALKRVRVEPVMQDGHPVEALRTFAFRIQFVMR
ncbi:MAG: hypothetical protein QM820_58960 [Minicystis sp.]